MIVNPSREPRIVDDYDLLFSNGMLMPLTIDKDAGDEIDTDTTPLVIKIKLASKASPTDPSQRSSQEVITVFVSHLISITHRTREVLPPTPEQAEVIHNLIQRLHPTIQ